MKYSSINDLIRKGDEENLLLVCIDNYQEALLAKLHPTLELPHSIHSSTSTHKEINNENAIDVFINDKGEAFTPTTAHLMGSDMTEEMRMFDLACSRLKVIPKLPKHMTLPQQRIKGNTQTSIVCNNIKQLSEIHGVSQDPNQWSLVSMKNALERVGRNDVRLEGLTPDHRLATFCWSVKEVLSEKPSLAISLFLELRRR